MYVVTTKRFASATIPVCWEAVDPATATERDLVRSAVEETWQSVSAVRFSGWGECAAGASGIRIREKDTGPYTTGLGTEIDGVKDGMVLNFQFTTWSPGCQRTRPYCIRVGAVHEFGHALGFAHEQNRADTPSWCTEQQGSDGDFTVGAWDLDSVMNYCNPRWTGDGKLSATDIEGVRAAYGAGGDEWEAAISSGSSFAAPVRGQDEKLRGADAAFLADVTGDGRTDLVVVLAATGELRVAPALSGTPAAPFGPLATWLRGSGAAATSYLFGDVTGDGKADAVAFFDAGGSWSVAASTGSAFSAHAVWKTGHGAGSTAQLLADATGDGKADAVAFFGGTGNWWVAPASGSAFSLYSLWKSGHGAGSAAQLLADVTGDGKADAVAFFDSSGNWWVAPSSGSAFAAYSLWKSGHGVGSAAQLLADVTGDGKADALAFFRGAGNWWVAPSSGTGTAFGAYSLYRGNFGTALANDMAQPILGDVDGDGKHDAVLRWRR